MARSRHGASEADARLRSIPDEDILDFLAGARARKATPSR